MPGSQPAEISAVFLVRQRRRIHGSKVLGDARVGVKAVHGVEQRRQLRALFRQVFFGAATQNQHINLLGVIGQRVHRKYRRAGVQGGQLRGCAAGKNSDQRHVWVEGQAGLNATAQIAVAGDTDPNAVTHGVCVLVNRDKNHALATGGVRGWPKSQPVLQHV